MKPIYYFGTVATLIALSANAYAGHRYEERYVNARVIHVEPIVHVTRVPAPRQECYTEEVRTPVYHGYSREEGTLAGGFVGGALAHELTDGDRAGTIAGTLVGAFIGNRLSKNSGGYVDEVSYVDHCRTVRGYTTQEHVEGYRVTYRLRGQTYTTQMPYHPGRHLRVRVSVSPVVQ